MNTLKIKSTNPEQQGDFVEIDAVNFDPATMTLLEGETAPVALSVGIGPADGESKVDYAVRIMTAHYDFMNGLSHEEQGEFTQRMIAFEQGKREEKDKAEAAADAGKPARETAAQKRARLAQEAEAAALAEKEAADAAAAAEAAKLAEEATKQAAPPELADTAQPAAPSPTVLPPAAPVTPAPAPGWGNPVA